MYRELLYHDSLSARLGFRLLHVAFGHAEEILVVP